VGSPFQVAEDQRRTPLIRQPPQFGVQDGTKLSPGDLLGAELLRRRFLLMTVTCRDLSPGLERYPVGDAMKPARQGGMPPHGAKVLSHDQKRRLERVLGILLLL